MDSKLADNADTGTKLTRIAVIVGIAIAAWQLLPMIGQAKTGPDPKAVITGPDHVVAGSFITLKGDASIGGTSWEWEVEPKLDGVIQFELIDGGKSIRPASIPGVWKYRLSVWNAFKKSDAFHTVTVTGSFTPTPLPVDPPQPKPANPVKPVDPPKPVEPPPQPTPTPAVLAGTAKAVYDFAIAVQSSNRPATCRELAAKCRAVAERINGKGPDAIRTRAAAAQEIVAAMDGLPPEWDQFRSKVGAYLHGLYTNGQMKTVDAIKAVVLEGATGFDAAALKAE